MVVLVVFKRVFLADGLSASDRAHNIAALAFHHLHEPVCKTFTRQSRQRKFAQCMQLIGRRVAPFRQLRRSFRPDPRDFPNRPLSEEGLHFVRQNTMDAVGFVDFTRHFRKHPRWAYTKRSGQSKSLKDVGLQRFRQRKSSVPVA